MPAYNFQDRFADPVENRWKRHTIRWPRKRPTRPGDTLYLYNRQRSKRARLLAKEVCTKVVPVVIESERVILDGELLDAGELENFAQSDGFLNAADFFQFWRKTFKLKPGMSFKMEVIHW